MERTLYAYTGDPIERGKVAFCRLGEKTGDFCLIAGTTPRGSVRAHPFDRRGFAWADARAVPAADVDDILTPAEVKGMQLQECLPPIPPAFFQAEA